MQIRKERRVEPPLETAKYDIRIQICAQKFLGALDIDINGSRHTCISLCTWIECSTSLERNHYITSKQRKVAVFSSTFAWEYGSIGVIPRLYSICLYSIPYTELSAILRFVKISMSTIAFDRVNKSPIFLSRTKRRNFCTCNINLLCIRICIHNNICIRICI